MYTSLYTNQKALDALLLASSKLVQMQLINSARASSARERKQRALDWTPAPSHLQKERYVHTCILTYIHLYMHTTVSRISVRGAFFRCLLSGPSDSSPRSKRQRRLSLVCSRHADMLVCLLPPPACAPMHACELCFAGQSHTRAARRRVVWRGGCQQPCGLRLAGWSGEGVGMGKM